MPNYPSNSTPTPNSNEHGEWTAILRNYAKGTDALAVEVRIPFCPSSCSYCTEFKVVTKDRSKAATYLNYLLREIALTAQQLPDRPKLQRLSLVGGTPLFLDHEQLKLLMNTLDQYFDWRSQHDCDVHIDVDPREADWATLGLLRQLGFNRIRLTIHDLDPTVQRSSNRLHTYDHLSSLIEAARTLQMETVECCIMYGLPHQTPESLQETLHKVSQLQPERIYLKAFHWLPEQFPSLNRLSLESLPSDPKQLRENSRQQLIIAGYQEQESEVFIRLDDLKANHTNHPAVTELLGFGLNALNIHAGKRYRNPKEISHWKNAMNQDQLPNKIESC